MNFKIKKEDCIGCRLCQSICPDHFVVEDGLAKPIKSDKNSCNPEDVIGSCPTGAISKEDAKQS